MGNWKLTRTQEPQALTEPVLSEMRKGQIGGLTRRQLIRRSIGAAVALWLLEVGKLEGPLERSLRNPATRTDTVMAIAERIVTALEVGLGRNPATAMPLSPPPGGVGSAPPGKGLQASSADE